MLQPSSQGEARALVVDALLMAVVIFACIYAIMTAGLTVTYMTTKVPNFAYGSFVTVGVYVAYTLNKVYGVNPYYTIPGAFLLSGTVAVLMYVLVIRPLTRRGASLVSKMIATLAVDVTFVGIFGAYSSYLIWQFGNCCVDAKRFPLLGGDFFFAGLRGLFIITPLAVAGLAMFLYLLLNRTRFGVSMRASVENPSLAKILGVNVDRVYLIAWFLAGGLAGLAGPLFAMNNGGANDIGSGIIVAIFSAAVLGGLTSVMGGIIGGLIIGGGQLYFTYLGAQYLGNWFTNYQNGIPLLIMIITLLFFPQGLVAVNYRKLLGSKGKAHG